MLETALEAYNHGDLRQAELLLLKYWDKHHHAAAAALLGQVMRAEGRWSEAIDWFSRALQADPEDARPRLAMGQIHRQLGDPVAARGCFEEVLLQAGLALAFVPEQPQRLLELGLAYAELDQTADAIAALEAAINADPAMVDGHQALTRLLRSNGRILDAARIHALLAHHQPSNITPRLNLAICHHLSGDQDRSLHQLEALLAEAPADQRILQTYLFITAAAGPGCLAKRQKVADAYWTAHRTAINSEVGSCLSAQIRSPLRVAILTAEPGSHPVSFFLESFLRHHDRSRLQVELVETRPLSESRDGRLRGLAHASLQLPKADQAQQRDLIRDRGYTVIVETSGFTAGSGLSLLAERLAPVQCHYIGFHASTLLSTIDWFIADPVLLPPELEYQFSERIWRLPRPWAAYTPPHELPALDYRSDGAPPVFGSFNQIAKLGSATFTFWASVMSLVETAQLLVKHRHTADPLVRSRILEALEQRGVAPERVCFEGWAPDWSTHMDTYNRIDVALDTTPWSSATTAFEALAMGTPLVAIRGATLSGRMSCAALEGCGEAAWIADTPSEFAAIAGGLVANLPRLRAGRASRRAQFLASPLFNGPDLAEALGTALEEMVGIVRNPTP